MTIELLKRLKSMYDNKLWLFVAYDKKKEVNK